MAEMEVGRAVPMALKKWGVCFNSQNYILLTKKGYILCWRRKDKDNSSQPLFTPLVLYEHLS